jgi:hypothetical protein
MGSCFSSDKSKPLSSNANSSNGDAGYNPKSAVAQGGKGGVDNSAVTLHESSSVVLGGEMDTLKSAYKPDTSPHRESRPKQPTVVLVPHQHTLFCERKQRVCTAVGKYQELEILKVRMKNAECNCTIMLIAALNHLLTGSSN